MDSKKQAELNLVEDEISQIEQQHNAQSSYEQQIKDQQLRESKAWNILEGWNLKLYHNTLTLFAAPEGSGKTLITTQFVKNAIKQGKTVVFFGNEENAATIYRRLKERFGSELSLLNDALRDDKLKIICANYCHQYKVLPEKIKKDFTKYDVVIIDQLNYMTEAGDGSTDRELYAAIPSFLTRLKSIINAPEQSPAFICTQQMFPPERDRSGELHPDRWSMNHLLRDSKNSKRQCTHALMYYYDAASKKGWLKLDKFRETVNPDLKVEDRVAPVLMLNGQAIVLRENSLTKPVEEWSV